MINGYKHKGLELFATEGNAKGINHGHAKRIRRILTRLDSAAKPEDMNIPGLRFHEYKGNNKGLYSLDISKNRGVRILFKFDGKDFYDVDYQRVH